MARRLNRVVAIALALSVAAAACSDSDAPETLATTTTAAPADVPTTTTSDAPEETPTTEASTTTTTAATAGEPIPVIDVDEIPALIEAWGEGVEPALELAQDIIGFPLDLAPISDGGAYSLSVELYGEDPETDWEWDWSYVTAAAVPIGEIDIALDDSGAGAVALRDHYEPILKELGWSYSNSTGSDPSSGGGGPQSINHVFQHDTGTIRLGEIDASTNPLFVWADEDIDFRDGEEVPGYRIDVSLESQPNFIPVPMLEALFREVPVAPGARLIDVSLRSRDRPSDSFDAEYGLRYFELEYVCDLLPNSANAAQEVYSVGLAGSAYQIGEESFFDEGFIEATEPRIDGDTWTQKVVVLDRYPGEIIVETDPETGAVQSTVRIRLEPNRAVLSELPD